MTSRDVDRTRLRLLAAARTEFAEHGMGGARVDRIALGAGVNKERIYGIFGSKEKLFSAVVAEAFGDHAARVGLPTGDLGEYAGRIFDFHRDNPELTRLMLWEALHYGTSALPDEGPRSANYAGMVSALAEATGGRADERTAATLLSVIGLAIWPLAVPQLARLIAGDVQERPEEMRAHVVRMAGALPAAGGC
ncbi:TetR family transcriptional regulator [Kitasatospora sp. RB6PN24]|uniref:TetR family transcriptional regulator n=1 Tax=Kitasatospora humi TaxID=2893891 RepID=UPI001E5322AF|nr:TetR family transcriptional regulator [Kitasatospora humi]MCC9308382.1 TetR family transcriptional regulator [Kitasatospora humi]